MAGKSLQVEILLETEDGVYSPLDIVRGHVEVEVQEPTRIKGKKLNSAKYF